MIKGSRNTHKHTRISPTWGEEYSYYERYTQLKKAHDLMDKHHPHRSRRQADV